VTNPDYRDIFKLDGRAEQVVGGGSGIGRANAIAAAGFGARCVVADVKVDGAVETVAVIVQSTATIDSSRRAYGYLPVRHFCKRRKQNAFDETIFNCSNPWLDRGVVKRSVKRFRRLSSSVRFSSSLRSRL